MFYKDERLAIFIDGASLFSTSRSLDFDIDYKALRDEFLRRGKLIRAFYYTTLIEGADYSPSRPLVDWLDYNGFSVRSKMVREHVDSNTGRKKVKTSINVDLVVDALSLAPHMDHAVLFTGDGEITPLVEALQRKGCRVSVASSAMSNPPIVSDELRRQVDNFIEIDDLRDVVGRPQRERVHA